MKFLIWKLTYKVIDKWLDVAVYNGLVEQAKECIEIERKMVHYRAVMIEKGLW